MAGHWAALPQHRVRLEVRTGLAPAEPRARVRRLRAELDEAERRWRVGEEPASGDPGPDEGAP